MLSGKVCKSALGRTFIFRHEIAQMVYYYCIYTMYKDSLFYHNFKSITEICKVYPLHIKISKEVEEWEKESYRRGGGGGSLGDSW